MFQGVATSIASTVDARVEILQYLSKGKKTTANQWAALSSWYLKKPPLNTNFSNIFEILTSSGYEKSCQIIVRIFGVFVVMKIVPW